MTCTACYVRLFFRLMSLCISIHHGPHYIVILKMRVAVFIYQFYWNWLLMVWIWQGAKLVPITAWKRTADKPLSGLVQDCNNSTANALELIQSCTKQSILNYIDLVYLRLRVLVRPDTVELISPRQDNAQRFNRGQVTHRYNKVSLIKKFAYYIFNSGWL